MRLLAYDPGRLLALRGAVRVAAKDLEGFRCDDSLADAAMTAVALAHQQLTELCLQRIQAILDANPLDGYHPTSAAPNSLGEAVVAARARAPGWRLSSDPDRRQCSSAGSGRLGHDVPRRGRDHPRRQVGHGCGTLHRRAGADRVKISAQEMYEAQQHAGPDGLGQVAPAAGDVFVVMNRVEYDGDF